MNIFIKTFFIENDEFGTYVNYLGFKMLTIKNVKPFYTLKEVYFYSCTLLTSPRNNTVPYVQTC